MAKNLAISEYDELVGIVVPVILDHVDPNFDQLLSSWMGSIIQNRYMVISHVNCNNICFYANV